MRDDERGALVRFPHLLAREAKRIAETGTTWRELADEYNRLQLEFGEGWQRRLIANAMAGLEELDGK